MACMLWGFLHYTDVIMGTRASQITSLTLVYSIVYSDAIQRKHRSFASLGFVRGIHRGPVNSPHKWPVTRKMFPFDDVIMRWLFSAFYHHLYTRRHRNKNIYWFIYHWYLSLAYVNHTWLLYEWQWCRPFTSMDESIPAMGGTGDLCYPVTGHSQQAYRH